MKIAPLTYTLLSLLAPLVVGCAGATVSPTDKSLIAQADQLHIRLAPAVVDNRDARLKRYLALIAARVTTAAQQLDQQGTIKSPGEGAKSWMFARDVEFHLVNSDLPNVFPSGGRHIYVYNGLFQQCQSEDELAAVLCHAYAHVYARHVQQDLRRDPSHSGEQALLFPFVALELTPAQERAANVMGFDIYLKAGWDPGRFTALYEQLYNAETPGVDRARLRDEVAAIRDRQAAIPAAARDWASPPVADDVRFAQLQAETQSTVASTPRSAQPQLLLAAFPNCLAPTQTPPSSPPAGRCSRRRPPVRPMTTSGERA